LLVGTFVIQTTLIYVDDSGYKTPRLSATAQRGRKLWHDNNCQSCHQLYGFGGFLGPDLTNAVPHIADERLQTILTDGMLPMPAFHFSTDEIEAITAFLSEVDATGTGQFRFVESAAANEVFSQLVEKIAAEEPMLNAPINGYQLVQDRKCIGCHLPNLMSTQQAPDLCDVIVSPGVDGITATLRQGRIARGMPQFELTADEQAAIVAFLRWMHEHRDVIQSEFKALAMEHAQSARIPWFEYDK